MNREFEELIAREKHIREEIVRCENEEQWEAVYVFESILKNIMQQKAKFANKIGRKQR